MNSIKLSNYFKIVKPNYIYLKVISNNSIRNYNSDKIVKAATTMYRKVAHRIVKYEKQICFNCPAKISYYIYIEKEKVEFYFIIPDIYLGLFKEKISDTWKDITITQVDEIPLFSEKATRYKLKYTKEDGLSLATDKRTNTLLSSLLSVINIMEEKDKIGIFYNFMPTSKFTWKAEYKRTMQKIKNNEPVEKDVTLKYLFKMVFYLLNEIFSIILETAESIFNVDNTKNQQEKNVLEMAIVRMNEIELTKATKKKANDDIIKSQIMVVSESNNKRRKINNAISVCEGFKTINEDNELKYKKINNKKNFAVFRKKKYKDINFLKYKLDDVDSNKTSMNECQNFIALPGRELLKQYKMIDKIDTYESEVPKSLQSGVMCLGTNTYKGKKTKAYLTTDKEYKNLALIVIAPTRAGKTTLLQNLGKDAINNAECNICLDFVSECEFSNELGSVLKKDNVLTIRYDENDYNRIQGLGYNEVEINESDSVFIAYNKAKQQSVQLLTLINSINVEDKVLAPKMERYLVAASLVVFIGNGSIKDVFKVLQNHKIRHKYINNVPKNQTENFEEYIDYLCELDDKDKKGEIIGTRYTLIAGIIDRLGKLKLNTYMEMALKKNCDNNINLVKEIQKSQLIKIQMPESAFATEQERDIICTYWITKIWLALQMRKHDVKDREKLLKVNIFVDELYQVKNTQKFITSKLSQMAKFGGKMIISCHYLKQIDIIRNELRSANTSYMLISGCDEDNYKELKNMLLPYEIEDLLNLKRYHSLNLIKYGEGYAKFITELPKPIVRK